MLVETWLHGYIFAFLLCVRLEQVICTGTRSQTRCHIRLDMCLTIICGKADVRPALFLPPTCLPKAICSITCLPCVTNRVEQRDLDESDPSKIEMVIGDLTWSWQIPFSHHLVAASNPFRTCLFWSWGRWNADSGAKIT